MKVKFKYGIRSYSGALDDLVYANYADRDVVIGRMLPRNHEITAQNIAMGSKAIALSTIYAEVSDGFKEDLAAYLKKMYQLKEYRGKIKGNTYTTFVKMMWGASKDSENPLDIESLSVDDLALGAYTQIENVKVAVENGYLPKVTGYEEYTKSIYE